MTYEERVNDMSIKMAKTKYEKDFLGKPKVGKPWEYHGLWEDLTEKVKHGLCLLKRNDAIISVAMQEEAIREAFRYMMLHHIDVDKYLISNGYIPEKEGE